MPRYEYEHQGKACNQGRVIEVSQTMADEPLEECPHCGGPVKKIKSRPNENTPKTDSELRDLGFTKLVRREDGNYENVTARSGDSKVMVPGDPSTVPKV